MTRSFLELRFALVYERLAQPRLHVNLVYSAIIITAKQDAQAMLLLLYTPSKQKPCILKDSMRKGGNCHKHRPDETNR